MYELQSDADRRAKRLREFVTAQFADAGLPATDAFEQSRAARHERQR